MKIALSRKLSISKDVPIVGIPGTSLVETIYSNFAQSQNKADGESQPLRFGTYRCFICCLFILPQN